MLPSVPWSPTITNAADRDGYWGTQSKEDGTVMTSVSGGGPSCWRCQHRFSRTTPAATREDIATTTLHIAKNPGAGQRAVGVTTELAAIEAILDVFWGTVTGYMSAAFTLTEYRWFKVAANDPLSDEGYPMHGPPIRITGKSLVGTNSGFRGADQVSATITSKTASRKHWGRIYLPGIKNSLIEGTYGRFTTAYVDAMGLAYRTLVNSLAAAAGGVYELGVWSPRGLAFLNTTSVQVDDIPDIIRRRRAKQAAYFRRYTS